MGTVRSSGMRHLDGYSLLQALLTRRSRRFPLGSRLEGPLAYESNAHPEPLSMEEEALLAFAASGITWYALGDLPYPGPGAEPAIAGTTILGQLIGRTTPSGDALNSVLVFVMNDAGTYVLRRPQDLSEHELKEMLQLVSASKFVEAYELLRVQVSDRRVAISAQPPYTLPFNNWAANHPGSTYFLPVSEISALYINALLWAFGDGIGYYVLDERNPFHPHGPLGRFRRSKGGHLYDDPRDNRMHTIGIVEAMMFEFAALEQGAIIQNLSLMANALGLGGFPHFAAHPYAWFQALGFKFAEPPPKYSATAGGDWPVHLAMKLSRLPDIEVPTPVGFNDAWNLVQPYCPPNQGWTCMRDAVAAYVKAKFSRESGHLRDTDDTPWMRNTVGHVLDAIPAYSENALKAGVAYCEYVHERYGMFPAHGGPFRTEQAFQAHHLDLKFYDTFYQPAAIGETQRNHWANWHQSEPAVSNAVASG
jgi:hypothetical protein